MKRYSMIAALMGLLAFAPAASAHPGHGEPGNDFGLIHYLTEPLHIGVGVCGLVLIFLAFKLFRSGRSRSQQEQSAI